MDNKLKLNARCNWWNLMSGFWICLAKLFSKMNNFALNKAMRSQNNVFNVLREMLREDYPECYKREIMEVINMR